jgi:7-cyano-7-deazaguanine synthase
MLERRGVVPLRFALGKHMTKTKALVLFSGGQDSTIALYWAMRNFNEVEALSIHYMQKHSIEIDSASQIARMANVPHRVRAIGAILAGKSPLTNDEQKLETYDNYEQMQQIIGDRVELTFVPMRNALFLVLAANQAAVMGVENIVCGVCEADGANYPDCREEFIHAMSLAIDLALGASTTRIYAPLLRFKKSESVKLALSLPGCYTALGYSHTAYDGKYPPTGKDHASVLRAHGFEEAGVPDPLVVRAILEQSMKPPTSKLYDPWRYLADDQVAKEYDIVSAKDIKAVLQNLEQQLRKTHPVLLP